MGCMVSTASSCAWALLCLRCQERKKLSLHPLMPWFLVSLWSFSESLLLHHLTEVLGCCSGNGFTAGRVTEICSGRWHDLLPAVCHQQIFQVLHQLFCTLAFQWFQCSLCGSSSGVLRLLRNYFVSDRTSCPCAAHRVMQIASHLWFILCC